MDVRTHIVSAVAVTAVMGAARISQLDADGIHDRAYRLYYNEGQNRTDLFATVGSDQPACHILGSSLLLAQGPKHALLPGSSRRSEAPHAQHETEYSPLSCNVL